MKDNNSKKKLLNWHHKIGAGGCLFLILLLISFNVGCQSLDGTGNPPNGKIDISSDTSSDTPSDNSSGTEDVKESTTADENTAEDTSNGKEESEKENSSEEGNLSEEENQVPQENEQNQTEEKTDIAEGELTINVYYADPQVKYLVGESREISSDKNKYIEALNELMKLPVDSSLIRLIPDTTRINSVKVEGGIAKVDLSSNFVEDRATSDTEDILLIYSIVNTLTEFPDIEAVTFYIDGEKLNVLGMLDLQNPLYRRGDLIKS